MFYGRKPKIKKKCAVSLTSHASYNWVCMCVFVLDKAIHNRQLSVERPLEEQVSEMKNIYNGVFLLLFWLSHNIFRLWVPDP